MPRSLDSAPLRTHPLKTTMGLEIDRDHFDEDDFVRFDRRLRESLAALDEVLARPGFGAGETTIGAELELHLVDAQGRPAPINRKVLAGTVDPRVTLEVDRFNLEVNTRPLPMAGAPLTALAAELDDALGEVRRAAARHGARAVAVGILPTLTEQDLTESALTEGHRYRALRAGIERLRRAPPSVHIEGADSLTLDCADVAFEGANASFQVHLRVPPADFARVFNAAQMATAPALAASCNSPLFLGRRLWDETRVALFKQATDDRGPDENDWRAARVSFGHGWVRRGAFELFAESVALHEPLLPVLGTEDPLAVARGGGVPALAELRLHHGTVWRWNRAVWDRGGGTLGRGGPHLRVELRALPSGPTVPDMVANAAFLLGLTLGLAPFAEKLITGLTFGNAHRNFYQAARLGLDAEILWPEVPGERVRPVPATTLVDWLLPTARQGLVSAGVAGEEADRWLGIVAARVAARASGARWQRRTYDHLRRTMPPDDASHALLEAYIASSEAALPVHTWVAP